MGTGLVRFNAEKHAKALRALAASKPADSDALREALELIVCAGVDARQCAELGLTMDQLVRIANVILQSHREALAAKDSEIAKLREAADMALEALEKSATTVPYEGFGITHREAELKHQAAITKIKEAKK